MDDGHDYLVSCLAHARGALLLLEKADLPLADDVQVEVGELAERLERLGEMVGTDVTDGLRWGDVPDPIGLWHQPRSPSARWHFQGMDCVADGD